MEVAILIINEFFKRNIEAVSNEMEYVKQTFNGKIVAKGFMKQKPMQKKDIQDNIFIYSKNIYEKELDKTLQEEKIKSIFIFEEESNANRLKIINSYNAKVYVMLYRKPTREYIEEQLKKYKKLQKIFIEVEEFKKILQDSGLDEWKIVYLPTPAKIPMHENIKIYNPEKVQLLFASWNNLDGGDTTEVRGLNYIVAKMKQDMRLYLNVILRDNKTEKFIESINKNSVQDRVRFISVKNENDLIEAYDSCDFVIYFLQRQIIKDVPNSLVDGLSRGKPVLMTDVLDLSKDVSKYNIGKVYRVGEDADFYFDENIYQKMSINAFNYAKKHTQENFKKILLREINDEVGNI